MIDLSVLVCSTHTRYTSFGRAIQDQLWSQYAALAPGFQDAVEILMLTDNKKMTVGRKRNLLLDMAQGRYVVFVDDDDRIESDYLVHLVDATRSDADVITFLASVSLNGAAPKLCRYSTRYERDHNTRAGYGRIPNHICAVRYELARAAHFPDTNCAEDVGYAQRLKPLLKSEHAIEKVLYHYDYNVMTTETQTHQRRKLRSPLVDVVMLSKASTQELERMTQEAIDTCIAGAEDRPISITVLEQERVHYEQAKTIYVPTDFHYNHFANVGAAQGSAPWIMVANNDLIFREGWLSALLAADWPVVSPKSPGDPRQAHITQNTVGTRTGTHLSGWCFMLKRDLWEKMGGFDEDFGFWCADDAVIEQLKALDVAPMLVPTAIVEHRVAATHAAGGVTDDLTWGQIEVFNRKYGSHRLSQHPNFIRWKANR